MIKLDIGCDGKGTAWPGPTLADRFNWAVHQEGHRWAYDLDSLLALATRANTGARCTRVLSPFSRYRTRGYCEIGVEVIR